MEFQSTRPVRGATRCGLLFYRLLIFQSTRPVRGATFSEAAIVPTFGFQSTRPVRGATKPLDPADLRFYISIHAPRAGRDRAHRRRP